MLQDNSSFDPSMSQKAMYVCTMIKHSGAVSDVPTVVTVYTVHDLVDRLNAMQTL
jgi:hypothetical protein